MVSSLALCKDQIPLPLWRVVQRVPPTWVRGFRGLQFLSLLLTRSYRGLILSLNWWDMIDENLLLGGALMFDDIERLQRQGVEAVVNLCAERRDDPHRLTKASMDYLWLPVIDTCAPTLQQIEFGLVWMEQQLRLDRKLYIHCAAGVGRSAMLLACWYVYDQRMSAPQALRFLKSRHPQVSLTRRQARRLWQFWRLCGQTARPERLACPGRS